jgi:hypothetical protein
LVDGRGYTWVRLVDVQLMRIKTVRATASMGPNGSEQPIQKTSSSGSSAKARIARCADHSRAAEGRFRATGRYWAMSTKRL